MNGKKIISLVLVFALLLSTVPFAFGDAANTTARQIKLVKLNGWINSDGFYYIETINGKEYYRQTVVGQDDENWEIFSNLSTEDKNKVVNGGTASFFSNPVNKKALFGKNYEQYQLFYQNNSNVAALRDAFRAHKTKLASMQLERYTNYFNKDFAAQITATLKPGKVIENAYKLEKAEELRNQLIAEGKKITQEMVAYRAQQISAAIERMTVISYDFIKSAATSLINPGGATMATLYSEMRSFFDNFNPIAQAESDLLEEAREYVFGTPTQETTMAYLNTLAEFIHQRQLRLDKMMAAIDRLTAYINEMKEGVAPPPPFVSNAELPTEVLDEQLDDGSYDYVPEDGQAAAGDDDSKRDRAQAAYNAYKQALDSYNSDLDAIREEITTKRTKFIDDLKAIMAVKKTFFASDYNENVLSGFIEKAPTLETCDSIEAYTTQKNNIAQYWMRKYGELIELYDQFDHFIDEKEAACIALYTQYSPSIDGHIATYNNNDGSRLVPLDTDDTMLPLAKYTALPNKYIIHPNPTYITDIEIIVCNPLYIIDTSINLHMSGFSLAEHIEKLDLKVQGTAQLNESENAEAQQSYQRNAALFEDFIKIYRQHWEAAEAHQAMRYRFHHQLYPPSGQSEIIPKIYFEPRISASDIAALNKGTEPSSSAATSNSLYNAIADLKGQYMPANNARPLLYHKAVLDYLLELDSELVLAEVKMESLNKNIETQEMLFDYYQNMFSSYPDLIKSGGSQNLKFPNAPTRLRQIRELATEGVPRKEVKVSIPGYQGMLGDYDTGYNEFKQFVSQMSTANYYNEKAAQYEAYLAGDSASYTVGNIDYSSGTIGHNAVNNYFNQLYINNLSEADVNGQANDDDDTGDDTADDTGDDTADDTSDANSNGNGAADNDDNADSDATAKDDSDAEGDNSENDYIYVTTSTTDNEASAKSQTTDSTVDKAKDDATVSQKDWRYQDVSPTASYYEAVENMSRLGLLKGTGDGKFTPEQAVNRAMLITVLHRLSNAPTAKQAAGFNDVPSDSWFGASVAWAAEQGLVKGYNAVQFGPLDTLNKEQIITVLYRYQKMRGKANAVAIDLSAYADGAEVSDYAKEAVAWAAEVGILTLDNNGKINPKSTITRALLAVMVNPVTE